METKLSFIYAYTITIYSHTPHRKCLIFNVRLSKQVINNDIKKNIIDYLSKKHNIHDIIAVNISKPSVININDDRFPKSIISSVIVI